MILRFWSGSGGGGSGGLWILTTGFWADLGEWDDAASWQD